MKKTAMKKISCEHKRYIYNMAVINCVILYMAVDIFSVFSFDIEIIQNVTKAVV